MRLRPPAALLASLVTVTLGTTLAVAPSASADDRPDRRPADVKAAQKALRAAEASVSGGPAEEGAPRDRTLAMRDLFVAKDALRGADRAAAERLLARPTTPPDDPNDLRDIYYGPEAELHTQCSDDFCLHWVEEGPHAATPEFAAMAFDTITHVARVYAAAGFRAPLPDTGQEGGTQVDFYLGDIDSVGALGFCRSDGDGPVDGAAWYAYCGFDNDFASTPWLAPADALHIAVAHEYFHAVQFAYDAEDDGWLMESTATAMEDVLYDEVNDNAFFLNFGQMGDPEVFGPPAGPATPLDSFDINAYGNWGFWRYLTENYDDTTAGVPNLLREVWEALDTTQGADPSFSLQAIDQVLAARGTSTPEQYVAFADANQHPGDAYEEALEVGYPTAPDTLDPVTLSRTAPTASRTASLDHLTSATGEVLPFAGSRQLTVRVDLADAALVRAAVTVHGVDGSTSTSYVPVNPQGKGTVTVPFASGSVSSVEVTLANGSTRMRDCGSGSSLACGGVAVDDALVSSVRFQAVG